MPAETYCLHARFTNVTSKGGAGSTIAVSHKAHNAPIREQNQDANQSAQSTAGFARSAPFRSAHRAHESS